MPRLYLIAPSDEWFLARCLLKEAYRFLDMIKGNINDGKLDMTQYISQVGNSPKIPVYMDCSFKYALYSLQAIDSRATMHDVISTNWKGNLSEYSSYHNRKEEDEKQYLSECKKVVPLIEGALEKVNNMLVDFAYEENRTEWDELEYYDAEARAEEEGEEFDYVPNNKSTLGLISSKFWKIEEGDRWI